MVLSAGRAGGGKILKAIFRLFSHRRAGELHSTNYRNQNNSRAVIDSTARLRPHRIPEALLNSTAASYPAAPLPLFSHRRAGELSGAAEEGDGIGQGSAGCPGQDV